MNSITSKPRGPSVYTTIPNDFMSLHPPFFAYGRPFVDRDSIKFKMGATVDFYIDVILYIFLIH